MAIELTPPPKQDASPAEMEQWLHRLWLFLRGASNGGLSRRLENHIDDLQNPHQTTKAQVLASNPIVDADVATAANIAWTKVSKSGSSLADLTTRSASDLAVAQSENLTSTNAQSALQELQTDIDALDSEKLDRAGGTMTGTLRFADNIGMRFSEVLNGRMGVTALVAGTIVVPNSTVTATSRIFLTAQDAGTAQGALYVSARVAGTSFTITSTNILDDRSVAYLIVEPNV